MNDVDRLGESAVQRWKSPEKRHDRKKILNLCPVRNQKLPSRSNDILDVGVRWGRRGEGVGGDLLFNYY